MTPYNSTITIGAGTLVGGVHKGVYDIWHPWGQRRDRLYCDLGLVGTISTPSFVN